MGKLLFLIYDALVLAVLPPVLLFMAGHALFRPDCRRAFLQKLSIALPELPRKIGTRVWIHAVSVGEVLSCVPLIRLLQEKGMEICLSTGTQGGFETAKTKCAGIEVFFFPLDCRFVVQRFVNRVVPDIVLLCEVELWPRFIREVGKRGIPVYLVSGRLGGAELRSYRLVRFFFRRVLEQLDGLFMQSPCDADHMRELCNHGNIRVLGNLKLDGLPGVFRPEWKALLPGGDLLCAASTHEGEEEIVLDAYEGLARIYPRLGLILAPRQVRRAGRIARMLERRGHDYVLRSRGGKGKDVRVLILDTVGELAGFFPACHWVVMGGSFTKKVGGHNPVEPALHGKCILCGPHMSNFHEIYESFLAAEALVSTTRKSLLEDLGALMENAERANRVGSNALRWVEENRGAADRVAMAVLESLDGSVGSSFGTRSLP